jgi:hypothetical protein
MGDFPALDYEAGPPRCRSGKIESKSEALRVMSPWYRLAKAPMSTSARGRRGSERLRLLAMKRCHAS